MRDYVDLRQVSVPYLMHFHAPSFVSPTVNTDPKGFRCSLKGGLRAPVVGQLADHRVCLLAGGSTAFGVGATADRFTIASALNELDTETWLNFGGRSFSSTQEYLLFFLHSHLVPRIRRIVFVSGVNDLVLFANTGKFLAEYGNFFESHLWVKDTEQRSDARGRLTRGWPPVFWQSRLERPPRSFAASGDWSGVSRLLQRNLTHWKTIARSSGCSLHYFLQPLAPWVDRSPCPEERRLFEALDKVPRNRWTVYRDKLDVTRYHWLRSELARICETLEVPFFDLNVALSGVDDWIFVDRIHLTDSGYRRAAQFIWERIDQ